MNIELFLAVLFFCYILSNLYNKQNCDIIYIPEKNSDIDDNSTLLISDKKFKHSNKESIPKGISDFEDLIIKKVI